MNSTSCVERVRPSTPASAAYAQGERHERRCVGRRRVRTRREAADVVSRLNQEIVHALTVPQVKEQIAKLGMEAVGSTPDQFGAFLKEENVRWSKVVRDLNLRAQ